MVIYFTEEDLVSFGNYMVSTERKTMLQNHPTFDESRLTERLGEVTDADIQNWAYLVQQKLNNG